MKLIKIIKNIPGASFLRKLPWWKKYQIRQGVIVKYEDVGKILDQAPPVILSELRKKPVVGIVKDNDFSFGGYVASQASWLRYERLLKKNDIPYQFYDIYKSDWLEKAKDLDIIIWHTASNPSVMNIAESKLYVLEKVLGKTCFPSFHEVWQYEDKCRANYLYQCLDIPSIPTIVTNSKAEALSIVNNATYPFITKTNIGSASTGVKKISSKKDAVALINKIFDVGVKSFWPYQRQKDYFYYQEFIDDATYDLRIMIVGNKAFGYYRYPNKGDYKASGSGNYEKKAIPKEALDLAISVKNKLNSRLMGIDMLYSEKNKKYYIIETSLFNQIDTAEQLVINGVPGYYDLSESPYLFKEGRFWIQELLLELVINEWTSK